MKYVPFVILGIMAALGSISTDVYGNQTIRPDSFGTLMSLGLAALYAMALFYVKTLDLEEQAFQRAKHLRDYISRLESRIYELQSKPPIINQIGPQLIGRLERIEKSTVICMEQITELDRRVQGNDPFGG